MIPGQLSSDKQAFTAAVALQLEKKSRRQTWTSPYVRLSSATGMNAYALTTVDVVDQVRVVE